MSKAQEAGKAFAELGISITEEQRNRLLARIEQAGAEFQANQRDLYRHWLNRFGRLPPHQNAVDEWTRLAILAGIPVEDLWRGKWTYANVLPFIETHLDRACGSAGMVAENGKPTNRRRHGVDAKMRRIVAEEPEWALRSSRKWATRLNCSPSTVCETAFWKKELLPAIEANKALRLNRADRRRP